MLEDTQGDTGFRARLESVHRQDWTLTCQERKGLRVCVLEARSYTLTKKCSKYKSTVETTAVHHNNNHLWSCMLSTATNLLAGMHPEGTPKL